MGIKRLFNAGKAVALGGAVALTPACGDNGVNLTEAPDVAKDWELSCTEVLNRDIPWGTQEGAYSALELIKDLNISDRLVFVSAMCTLREAIHELLEKRLNEASGRPVITMTLSFDNGEASVTANFEREGADFQAPWLNAPQNLGEFDAATTPETPLPIRFALNVDNTLHVLWLDVEGWDEPAPVTLELSSALDDGSAQSALAYRFEYDETPWSAERPCLVRPDVDEECLAPPVEKEE